MQRVRVINYQSRFEQNREFGQLVWENFVDGSVYLTDCRVLVPVDFAHSRLFPVPDRHKNKSDKPAKPNVSRNHRLQPKQNHEIFTPGHQIRKFTCD